MIAGASLLPPCPSNSAPVRRRSLCIAQAPRRCRVSSFATLCELLPPGLICKCRIIAQQVHGLDVEVLGNEGEPAVIDRRFLDDDISREPADFPVSSIVEAVVQGCMPSGQLRLTARASDIARARQELSQL